MRGNDENEVEKIMHAIGKKSGLGFRLVGEQTLINEL